MKQTDTPLSPRQARTVILEANEVTTRLARPMSPADPSSQSLLCELLYGEGLELLRGGG